MHAVQPTVTGASTRHARVAPSAITSHQRILFTKIAAVAGFAAGILLSPKLWVSSRFFPLIPVVRGWFFLRSPFDYLCAALMLLLLCAIGVTARPRAYIFGFATLLVVLAAGDQTRWQPWVYLYLFILLSLGCYSWRPDDVAGQQNALNICRLIVAATYFYSGLQKLNPHFAAEGVISLLGPRAANLPLVHVWPWVIAGVEAAIGIALLTRSYRDFAVVCGVLMHVFILYSGVAITHWNSVVWPWNAAMIAFLVVLFWRADFSFGNVVWRNPIRFQKVALLLFGVMPAFSFLGLWDSYLSASLYSGNISQANVLFRGAVKEQLPAPILRYAKQLPDDTNVLIIRDWAVGELNVMPYPAMRAYRAIGQQICRSTNNSPDVVLVMREKDTLLSKAKDSHDTCLGTLMVRKW